MEVKFNFDTINVFEENNPNYIKVLMLKGEKGDKGDPGSIVNEYSTSTSDGYSANYFNQHALKVEDKNNMGDLIVDSIEGKNLFDKDEFERQFKEGKVINNNGEEVSDSTSSYSTYKIYVKANQPYHIAGWFQRAYFYNMSGSLITRATITPSVSTRVSGTYTPSIDGYFMFQIGNTYWASNKGQEQVEIGSDETDYVPFMKYGYNSEESMGNIVVDDISCKNVFNMLDTSKFTYRYKGSSPYYQSFIKPTYSSNEIKVYGGGGNYTAAYIDVIGLKPNTQYTISYVIKENTLGFNPRIMIDNNGITDNNGAITLTLALQNGSTSASTSNYVIYSNIQLELGSEATNYTPYETYANSESEVYSENEIKIGRYVDGKPLYRKVIQFTSPSDNNFHEIATGSFDNIFIETFFLNIPVDNKIEKYLTLTNAYSLYSVDNSLRLKYLLDAEFYKNRPMTVIIKYTKTTD